MKAHTFDFFDKYNQDFKDLYKHLKTQQVSDLSIEIAYLPSTLSTATDATFLRTKRKDNKDQHSDTFKTEEKRRSED